MHSAALEDPCEQKPDPNLMPENRPFSDDEALWFPAHMSAGDSFLRVTRPDGAPEGPEGEDDGIGLPGRRPPTGGRRPPRKGFKAPNWLWIALAGTAAVGTLLVLARKEIAANITEGWLKGQGVPAEVRFTRLGLGRASGHIVLGDTKNPDVSVETFDATYSLHPFAGGGMPFLRLKTVHAVHPLVAVVVKDGKLHFGSIDKLVQAALSAPATGAPPPESIVLDDATVLIQTDYGAIKTLGDVVVRDGRLADLKLNLPKSQLTGSKATGEISGGMLTAKAAGSDRLEVHARLDAPRWELRNPAAAVEGDMAQSFAVRDLSFVLDGHVPYRKGNGLAAFAGAIDATLAIKAGDVQGAFGQAGKLDTRLKLDGATKAGAKFIEYEGAARLAGSAAGFKSADVAAQGLRLEGPALGLRARYDIKDGLSAAIGGSLTGEAGSYTQGGLSLRGARLNITSLAATLDGAETRADFKGSVALSRAAVSDIVLDNARATVTGDARLAAGDWTLNTVSDVISGGQYNGLKALADPRRNDPKAPPKDDIVALDRAFQRFTLRARGLKVSLMGQAAAPPHYDIRLTSAQADLNGGGRAVLTTERGKPVLSTESTGGFSVALNGPDLPDLTLDVSKLGYPADNSAILTGAYALKGQLTTAPVSGAQFDARGSFATTEAGGFNVTLASPITVAVASAELGTHVENVSATIAQRDGALLRVTPSGWRVSGTFSNLSLTAPVEGLGLSEGQGTFDAFSQGTSPVLGLNLTLAGGTAEDALKTDDPAALRRFNLMKISGALTQDTRRMSGHFIAATPSVRGKDGGPLPIVAIDLDNDPVRARGSLSFSTLDLTFDPTGLQPSQLSPLVAVVMSKDVTGKASFNGKFQWDGETTASAGVLETGGLNFTGAAGVSQGLKGRIVFTSLAPLMTAPGQKVTIARMQAGIPFENLDLSVQFQGDFVSVEGASVQSPGGVMTLEPMKLPLDGKSAITGAVAFNGLDFGKVIAATGLAQNMTFQGNLTGRVPFTILGGHITFANGAMAADAPGRISIKRTAVTDMTAGGSLSADNGAAAGASAAEFNPFQDLAFQAMEHLSYEQLDAKVNSLPEGKVNFNFHIKGRFDPPVPQKATVSISDYISGKWMQKPIKLPSGTPVELFLDVPVNLDEILNDLAQFNAGTAAQPVTQ